jgi:SAM-dependent methyltransferase
MTTADDYIHGVSPDEQRRLTALNDLINTRCLAELALKPGETVLDIGAGLGQLTRRMAHATGRRVIGIESSAAQRAEAVRQAEAAGEAERVEFRGGDARALALPEAEWGTYDVVHTRFVLEHVGDPDAVVRGMLRAARPGGRVVLADDDHDVLRLWPEPAGLAAVWAAYQETYTRAGKDPAIGRKLVELLHRAGARPVRTTWVWFGSCSGDATFTPLVRNLVDILRGARDAILAMDTLDGAAFDAAIAATRAFGARPDAALWFAIAWAEGVKT